MDYITSVTPVTENGEEIGYRIEFKLSEPIIIYHGVDAEVSLKQDEDGNWYWTLNGETLADAEGNPIRANALKPSLELGKDLPEGAVINDEPEGTKPEQGAVYLTIDEGKTWTKVSGPKGDTGATGSAGSTGSQGEQGKPGADNQGIDVTLHKEEGYVTFTLENGTTFDVPLVSEDSSTGFMIYDKENPATLENNDAITIEITKPTIYWAEQLYFKYPNGLKREDVSSVVAEIIGQTEDNLSNAPDNNFATRAIDGDKKIGVFVDTDDDLEGPNYYIYIKHKGMASGDTYMIRATLTKNDGSTLVTTRAIRFMEPMKVGDILYDDLSYSTNLISGKTPIGIIFSLDSDRIGEAEKEALAAKGVTKPTGLAMALSDASVPGNINYNTNSGTSNFGKETQSDYALLWCVGSDPKVDEGRLNLVEPGEFLGETLTDCFVEDFSVCMNDISGLANSQLIWSGKGAYGDVKNYPAFNAAKLYAENHNEVQEKTTGWFFPSVGQWIEILKNLGDVSFEDNFTYNEYIEYFKMNTSPEESIYDSINQYLEKVSSSSKLYISQDHCNYHTSSEGDNYRGTQIKIDDSYRNGLSISFGDKDSYDLNGDEAYRVRCILAF